MRKSIAAVSISASLLAGSAAGALLFTPEFVSAQEDSETDTESTDTESTDTQFRDRLADVLAPLVADGTITEAQRDAVVDTLEANRPERGPRGHRGHHGPGRILSGDVLESLGLDVETVREGLADGQTLAEVAEANGVATEDLVDALVAAAQERLDDAVDAGRITADDAADKAEELEERIEERVTSAFEGRPGHRFGGAGPADDTTDS